MTTSTYARPSLSPLALAASLRRHRRLLQQLVARDVSEKYRAAAGGMLWPVLTPVLMLAVYVLVFGVVFQVRVGTAPSGNLAEFGIFLFCGLQVHGLFAESLLRAPSAIVSQPSFVKKVQFPLELLPLTQVAGAFVHYLIGWGVLLAACALMQGLHASAVLMPLAMLPLLLLTGGVSLAVAALAVYLRDIAQITGLLATVLLFLSPVFFPAQALPEWLRPLLMFNPLTVPIESVRALLYGTGVDWTAWLAHAVFCVLAASLGWAFFQATRRGFADVL
jgi:lipopolysaccharide transport system permease protein